MLQRLVGSFCRIPGVISSTLLDANGLYLVGVVSSNEIAPSLDGVKDTMGRAQMIASEHDLGRFDQLWFENNQSNTLLSHISSGYSLIIKCDSTPNLGLLRHEIERAKPVFAQLI